MRYLIHILAVLTAMSAHSQEQKLLNRTSLQRVLDDAVDGKAVFGTALSLERKGERWTSASGDIEFHHPYFIASTTKLFVTAIILQLRNEDKIVLEDPIATYLPKELLSNLHVYKGVDYTHLITIRHLLSQTSGLPDYFEDKTNGEKSLLEEITSGKDQKWSFEETVEKSKNLAPKFPPGAKGKAHYSDTNFQLLGRIIELVTCMNFSQACQERIFQPLHLQHTYVYSDPKDTLPATMYYKKQKLFIPLAMSSFGPDGGIVSTSEESLVFIKAFFEGQLFPKAYFPELYAWNRVMFPLEYGVGLMRFKLPRIFSPFKALPVFLGHSGLSGAFAYYLPEKEVFLAGTVNQIHDPSLSYKMLIKLVNSLDK